MELSQRFTGPPVVRFQLVEFHDGRVCLANQQKRYVARPSIYTFHAAYFTGYNNLTIVY